MLRFQRTFHCVPLLPPTKGYSYTSLHPPIFPHTVLQEAHTLLSAGIVALSHVSLPWPLFIPVHDPLRDAYRGAAVTASGAVVHFETDSMHSSSLPMQFTYPAAQLDAFAARLRTRSPAAAALCAREAAAAAAVADDTGDFAAAPPGEGVHPGRLAPSYFVRRSYEVPDQQQRAVDNARQLAGSYDVELVISSWDEEAPWRPWAAEDDPIGEWRTGTCIQEKHAGVYRPILQGMWAAESGGISIHIYRYLHIYEILQSGQ